MLLFLYSASRVFTRTLLSQTLLGAENIFLSHLKNPVLGIDKSKRRKKLDDSRKSPKHMLRLYFFDMSIFSAVLRKIFQNTTYLSLIEDSDKKWRSIDFSFLASNAETIEKNWMLTSCFLINA